jgi:hypothetical protein
MLQNLIIVLSFLVFFFGKIKAQTLFFTFKDGTSAAYAVKDVQVVTYGNNSMRLIKKDGSQINWDLNTISNYRLNAATNIQNVSLSGATINIYPNPFRSSVYIRYQLPYTDKVAVEIVDMQGRVIKAWPSEQKVAGAHVWVWEAGASKEQLLLPGNYICRVITSKGSFSKIISAY